MTERLRGGERPELCEGLLNAKCWTDRDHVQQPIGAKRRNRPGRRERLRKKRRNLSTSCSNSVNCSEPCVESPSAAGWEDQSAAQRLTSVRTPNKPGRKRRLRRKLRQQLTTISCPRGPPEPREKQPSDTTFNMVTRITASLKSLNLCQVINYELPVPSIQAETAERDKIIRETFGRMSLAETW